MDKFASFRMFWIKGVRLLIKSDELESFLRRCREESVGPYREIHLPVISGERDGPPSTLARLGGQQCLALDGYRSVDPPKLLAYSVRERVAPFSGKRSAALLVGVKACDVKALEILDRALINEDFVDPAYASWRERTTVFSFDCTDVGPTCHCTLTGGKPFAETGSDANAARFGSHYFLRAATEKGQTLIDLIRRHVRVDTGNDRIPRGVEAQRAEMTARVQAQNEAFARPENYASLRAGPPEVWQEEARECVSCGACTHICPTCYCLILNEEGGSGDFVKVRSYDSCQLQGYARVAAGVSPRPRVDERFRHRYLCKFVFMKGEFGTLGCTGCGRCTEACPGGIEFRSVARRLMQALPDGRPAEAG